MGVLSIFVVEGTSLTDGEPGVRNFVFFIIPEERSGSIECHSTNLVFPALGRLRLLWHNQPMSLEKIALIDIGSNSMRLEIVAVRGDDFWTVARYKSSARIAAGMYPSLEILPEAIERAERGLKDFAGRIAFHRTDVVRCVATSAIRDAKNREMVLRRLTSSLGSSIEVLEGEREGWYSFHGVKNGFDLRDGLIFDIGGGSAEIIDVEDDLPRRILTLPLGAVRLSESFFSNRARPTAAEWKRLERYIAETLENSGMFNRPYPTLTGVGGTARGLARISQKLRKFPFFPDIHHYEVLSREIPHLSKKIGKHLSSEQARVLGVAPDRADILPAGIAVIAAIVRLSRAPSLTFSHYGLRQGLFMEYFRQNQEAEEPIFAETLHRLSRRYGRPRDLRPLKDTYSTIVAGLLPPSVGPQRTRILTHTIGTLDHLPILHTAIPNQRALWDLLLHGELPGISQKDRLLIGLVLCQADDRGRSKKKPHPYLRHLSKSDQKILSIMTSALILARKAVILHAGESPTISIRPALIRILPPGSDESLPDLRLEKTESLDMSTGTPVSVQWFTLAAD